MINLDKNTGYLKIEAALSIKPGSYYSEVKNMIDENFKAIESRPNSEWISYQIPSILNGQYALVMFFFKDVLSFLNISMGGKYNFPPFVITDEERFEIRRLLQQIGGEKKYSWGSIQYSEDYKGGSVSVLIKYV